MTNIFQHELVIATQRRGTYEITDRIANLVQQSKIKTGLCNLFLQHTSASLIICENADPTVRHDLETFMKDFIVDGDKRFQHTAEGKDDMPSHLRTIFTQTSLTIPICEHRLALGTWQGIFVWEHRLQSHQRTLLVTCS